jgi:mono/diheme cytochrome c family protein
MYHGIIQHKGYITEYLRDQILSRKLEQPQGHGRIYRVVHETTRRDRAPSLSKATPQQLVELLAHPNGWWRDTAQRLLVERGATAVAPALKQRAEKAPDWRTRVHALWTLDGLDSLEPATVTRALEDPSREVRASAVRLSERWLAPPNPAIVAALQKHVDDPDWAVRRQLAATLGALPDAADAKIATLTTMLERHGGDPIVVDAALSGLSGHERVVLQRLLKASAETPALRAALPMVAATIARAGQDAALQELFQWIAEPSRADWQRVALLEGAEAALVGGPLPGAGRRGGGAGRAAAQPADPTARGARGGPGGAPAFPRAEGGPAGTGRGRGSAPVQLTREPSALTAMAKSGGDTAPRATALLDRLTWPGKPGAPGAPAAAAPLTPAEQKRLEDGRNIYNGLCMACHQEDGQGREKLAPSLVGSALALAPPAIPVRVLLNGKEGSVGLMPPLGTTLSDDQIAAVLTYTRRSWGNQASAVDPAAVAEVRKTAAERTRPWTEAELTALIEKLR